MTNDEAIALARDMRRGWVVARDRVWNAAIEAAAKAADSKVMPIDDPECQDYNLACEDIAASIRNLKR